MSRSLFDIDSDIREIVRRKSTLRSSGSAVLADVTYRTLDLEYHGLLEERARKSAEPRKNAPRVGVSRESGIETIWLKNAVGGLPLTRRMIHGIASTSSVDAQNHVLVSRGMMAKLPIPLLSQHAGHVSSPIGVVTLVRKRDREIYVIGTIFEKNEAADYAWSMILDGSVRCLSVGARVQRVQGIVDGIKFIDRWSVNEISICRQGANGDCRFEIYEG